MATKKTKKKKTTKKKTLTKKQRAHAKAVAAADLIPYPDACEGCTWQVTGYRLIE